MTTKGNGSLGPVGDGVVPEATTIPKRLVSNRTPDWRRMVRGTLVTLGVAVPALALEETVGGRPMIDQPGHLWVIPAIVVALAFVAGGRVAARHNNPGFLARCKRSSWEPSRSPCSSLLPPFGESCSIADFRSECSLCGLRAGSAQSLWR